MIISVFTGAEQSQMTEAWRVETLVAVLALVAVRLLSTKLLASARPDEAVAPETLGPEALAILAGHYGEPSGGWTHRSLLVAVARLAAALVDGPGISNPSTWRKNLWVRTRAKAHGYPHEVAPRRQETERRPRQPLRRTSFRSLGLHRIPLT